jgi:hypothetical protein
MKSGYTLVKNKIAGFQQYAETRQFVNVVLFKPEQSGPRG